MITPATAGSSRMALEATFAMDTPRRSATVWTASSTSWKTLQPPAAWMKRAYFISDHVSSSSAWGSGRPSHRSVRNPPARVPKARSFTPRSRQSADIRPRARRSRREKHTWFETMGTPVARSIRRWAVSTFVRPRCRILPSLRRVSRVKTASSQPGWV